MTYYKKILSIRITQIIILFISIFIAIFFEDKYKIYAMISVVIIQVIPNVFITNLLRCPNCKSDLLGSKINDIQTEHFNSKQKVFRIPDSCPKCSINLRTI